MKKTFKQFVLKNLDTKKYFLTPIELKEYIPFTPKRVYFLQDVTGDTGAHCHYEEEELFVMIRGICTATIDRGNGIEEIPFKKNEAFYVPNYVWHGFKNFEQGSILLAVSSTNYKEDRSDYLEDYVKYLEIREEKLQKDA